MRPQCEDKRRQRSEDGKIDDHSPRPKYRRTCNMAHRSALAYKLGMASERQPPRWRSMKVEAPASAAVEAAPPRQLWSVIWRSMPAFKHISVHRSPRREAPREGIGLDLDPESCRRTWPEPLFMTARTRGPQSKLGSDTGFVRTYKPRRSNVLSHMTGQYRPPTARIGIQRPTFLWSVLDLTMKMRA
jgi:hypothetical protein